MTRPDSDAINSIVSAMCTQIGASIDQQETAFLSNHMDKIGLYTMVRFPQELQVTFDGGSATEYMVALMPNYILVAVPHLEEITKEMAAEYPHAMIRWSIRTSSLEPNSEAA